MKIRNISPLEGNRVRFIVIGVPGGNPINVSVQWGTKGRGILFSSEFNPEEIRGKISLQYGFLEIIKFDDSIFEITLVFNGTHNPNTNLKLKVSVDKDHCHARFKKI